MKKILVEISMAWILVLIMTYVERLKFGPNHPFGSLWPGIISDWRAWFIILSTIGLYNAIYYTIYITVNKRISLKYCIIYLLLIFLVFTIIMIIFGHFLKALQL